MNEQQHNSNLEKESEEKVLRDMLKNEWWSQEAQSALSAYQLDYDSLENMEDVQRAEHLSHFSRLDSTALKEHATRIACGEFMRDPKFLDGVLMGMNNETRAFVTNVFRDICINYQEEFAELSQDPNNQELAYNLEGSKRSVDTIRDIIKKPEYADMERVLREYFVE